VRRAGRLLDSYVSLSGDALMEWRDIVQPNGLCNVAASAFLRPYRPAMRMFEPLRRARLLRSMREAAKQQKIFHLWWHPHNFGGHVDENIAFLRTLLREYRQLERQYGMRSLTMAGTAALALAHTTHSPPQSSSRSERDKSAICAH
jgi:hypothetical protein